MVKPQSRTFASPLKSYEPILLRIERNSGHGGADLVKQQVERSADLTARHALGW